MHFGETHTKLDTLLRIVEPFQLPMQHSARLAATASTASADGDAFHAADDEETSLAVHQEADTETIDITRSRAASSLLDSLNSHIAVCDAPLSEPAPPDAPVPPVPPVPPLPVHIQGGRTILEKYSTAVRAARPRPAVPEDSPRDIPGDIPGNEVQTVTHNRQEARQSERRYATDGGVLLAGGGESTRKMQAQPDAHSIHSSSTMPPPYAEYN